MLPGLSSLPINWDSDKTVCKTKIGKNLAKPRYGLKIEKISDFFISQMVLLFRNGLILDFTLLIAFIPRGRIERRVTAVIVHITVLE